MSLNVRTGTKENVLPKEELEKRSDLIWIESPAAAG